MTRRREEAGFRDIGLLRLTLRDAHGIGGMGPHGDVGECNDDAFDPIVLGSVRQDAANIPGAVARFDLPLDRSQGLQNRSRVRQQRLIGRQ